MNPHSYRLKGRDFVHQGKIEIDVNERAVFIRTQGCFFVYTNSDCFLNSFIGKLTPEKPLFFLHSLICHFCSFANFEENPAKTPLRGQISSSRSVTGTDHPTLYINPSTFWSMLTAHFFTALIDLTYSSKSSSRIFCKSSSNQAYLSISFR